MTRIDGAVPRAARQQGFSLIELMVAAAIVGVLATAAIPVVELVAKRNKERELRVALRDIRKGIDAYKAASAGGRIALAPGDSGYPPSLMDLVIGVDDALNQGGPKLYFLRRLPRDPFHLDPSTPAANTWGQRSFDSPPETPRAGRDVFDVYSQSTSLGINGIPYKDW